jgi:Flp pilus assembly protein TadD
LVACGLPRDALSRVRSILEKKPEDRAAHEELAAIYWQLGMKQELEDEVRALMRLR